MAESLRLVVWRASDEKQTDPRSAGAQPQNSRDREPIYAKEQPGPAGERRKSPGTSLGAKPCVSRNRAPGHAGTERHRRVSLILRRRKERTPDTPKHNHTPLELNVYV